MHMKGLPAWQYPLALPACAIERNLFPPRRISIFAITRRPACGVGARAGVRGQAARAARRARSRPQLHRTVRVDYNKQARGWSYL